MNVIHSNVTLVEGKGAPSMPHVCVGFTGDVNVHVMGQFKNAEPTVTFHVWNFDGEKATLSRLILTEADIKRLVAERGTTD